MKYPLLQQQTNIFFTSASDEGETNSTFQLRKVGSNNVRINVDNPVTYAGFASLERNVAELE
jgi:hypothetical protein